MSRFEKGEKLSTEANHQRLAKGFKVSKAAIASLLDGTTSVEAVALERLKGGVGESLDRMSSDGPAEQDPLEAVLAEPGWVEAHGLTFAQSISVVRELRQLRVDSGDVLPRPVWQAERDNLARAAKAAADPSEKLHLLEEPETVKPRAERPKPTKRGRG